MAFASGLEEIDVYNKRAKKILDEFIFKHKDFILLDKGRRPDEMAVILIEDRHYAGYGYYDTSTQVNNPEELRDIIKHASYYPDADDMVRHFMNSKSLKILPLDKSVAK